MAEDIAAVGVHMGLLEVDRIWHAVVPTPGVGAGDGNWEWEWDLEMGRRCG